MKNISRYRSCIMGVAALWIYYFHIGQPGIFRGGIPLAIETFIQENGYCGVDIFLFLSSLGLAYSFRKRPVSGFPGYLTYLGRRLLRIYEVLIPVTLLVMLIDNREVTWFFQTISLYRNFRVDFFSYLWFIPCIIVLYAAAPLYYAVYSRVRHRAAFTAACAVISILLTWFFQNSIRIDLFLLLNRIPVFLLGFLAGDFILDGRTENRPVMTAAALVLLTVGNFLIWKTRSGWLPLYIPLYANLLAGLVAPPLSYLLAQLFSLTEKCRPGCMVNGILTLFGTISLEFYALQEWMAEKVALIDTSHWRLHLLCFFLTLTISCGIRMLLERGREIGRGVSHPAKP